MSAAREQSARRELENIEAALEETILASSLSELRHELNSNGDDPDAILKEMDDIISGAISQCAKENLLKAQRELRTFRTTRLHKSNPSNRPAVQARFEAIRKRDPELNGRMTVAARKGHGLSQSDLEGMLEDLEELDQLENDG